MESDLVVAIETRVPPTALEEVAAWIGCSLLVSVAVLEVAVGLTYLLGGALTRFHFLSFVAVLTSLLARGPRPSTPISARGRLALFVLGVFIVVVCFTLAGRTFDLSPDGQNTHGLGVASLAMGWDPVHSRWFHGDPDDPILPGDAGAHVSGQAKGTYFAAASAYVFLGCFECGKGFNLVLLSAAALLALAAAIGAGLSVPVAATVAVVAALNPVAILMALTTYLDGQNATLITCVLALTLVLARRHTRLLLVGWGAAFALLMAVKFNALLFAAFLGPGLLLYLRYKTGRFRGLCTLAVASILGFGVVGFDPYVKLLVSHGVFTRYRAALGTAASVSTVIKVIAFVFVGVAVMAALPYLLGQMKRLSAPRTFVVAFALGVGVIGSISYFAAFLGDGELLHSYVAASGKRDFSDGSNRVTALLSSIFSESAVNPDRSELKIPFQVRSEELLSYRLINPDHRVGGFGPWFGGSIIVACIVFVLIWVKPARGAADLAFLLALIFSSVMVIPDAWWARWVPQLWLLPILVAAYGCRPDQRTSVRRGAQVLLLILVANVGMITYQHVRGQLAIQAAVHQTMNALRQLPQPVRVRFSTSQSVRLRFREYGIQFVEVLLEGDCHDHLSIIRSKVGVCVGSDEDPGWQEMLAEARRIDKGLEQAGVGYFRVTRIDP